MTNIEALRATVAPYEADTTTLTKGLLDAGLDADATYGDEKKIDLVAIKILQKAMMLTGESEGGYSKSFSRDGVKSVLLMLCHKHGVSVEGLGGTIKAVRLW